MPVLVMATDTGDADVAAATWGATFVRRVPYDVGAPWPEGLPESWVEEHVAPRATPDTTPTGADQDPDPDEDPDEEPDDEDRVGPQSFFEVAELRPLPRVSWVFANELVGKQARGGRSFRPRVPTVVVLPD